MADTADFQVIVPPEETSEISIPEPECDAKLIPLNTVKVTDAEFTQAAQDLGMLAFSKNETKAIRTLGIYMEQMGGLHYAFGRTMQNMHTINKWLDRLDKIDAACPDNESRVHCAQVAAILIDKALQNDKNAAALVELQQNASPPARARNRSFTPGGMAPVNLMVNVQK